MTEKSDRTPVKSEGTPDNNGERPSRKQGLGQIQFTLDSAAHLCPDCGSQMRVETRAGWSFGGGSFNRWQVLCCPDYTCRKEILWW